MKKKFSLMKLIWLVILSLVLLPVKGNAQEQVRLNVAFENLTIEEVISQLKKQTGYEFVYQNNILSGKGRITLKMQNASLKDIMDRIVANNGLEYSILNKVLQSVCDSKQTRCTDKPKTYKISGTVIDSDGEPVIAVRW